MEMPPTLKHHRLSNLPTMERCRVFPWNYEAGAGGGEKKSVIARVLPLPAVSLMTV